MSDDFYEDLQAFLVANAGILAIVSNRVHPLKLPQEPTLPALTFQEISKPREYSHSGDSSLANPSYQITAWATTKRGAAVLGKAVRNALSGYSGAMGDTTVYSSFVQNEIDRYEAETGLYNKVQDFLFRIKEVLT